MSKLDDSNENDKLAQTISKDIKTFIKSSNKSVMDNLKSLLTEKFKVYYDEQNKNINEENQRQLKLQSEIQEKSQKYFDKMKKIQDKSEKNQRLIENLVKKNREKRLKSAIFLHLNSYSVKKILQRKIKDKIRRIYLLNLSRKSIKAWKTSSFHESNKNFIQKTSEKTELELKNYEDNLISQHSKILELIKKAEDRYIYEQKKKIQTKLMLDQVVLRGVSALNIQALKLSQSALTDVYKSDYLKEIETNVKKMVFPETKNSLNNFNKRSEGFQKSVGKINK